MKIQKMQNTPQYYKNNVSFQKIEIIHVSKKSANCIGKAEEIFSHFAEKNLGGSETLNILEYPFFQYIQDYLLKANKPSINWLIKNQKQPIPKINKEGYYTYFRFSGKEAQQFVENIMNEIEAVHKKKLAESNFFGEKQIKATLVTCMEFFNKMLRIVEESKNKEEIFI